MTELFYRQPIINSPGEQPWQVQSLGVAEFTAVYEMQAEFAAPVDSFTAAAAA